MRMLQAAKPGSAKNIVFKSYTKRSDPRNKTSLDQKTEAINEIINDPKTLLYGESSYVIPGDSTMKTLTDQVFALKMDDTSYGIGTLGLQKDSEFLQIFNHYILKALEGGELKRLFRSNYIDFFIKENFNMTEPQPLGLNNVVFCFTCLGFAICFSLIKVMLEFMIKKMSKKRIPAKTNERGERARVATIIEDIIE